MHRVAESFYSGASTVDIAKHLIGMRLVSNRDGVRTAGVIVETEAYLRDDPACHASKGRTSRNESMFLSPGYSYVYLIYGLHCCFNVVTAPSGIGEAVQVRAIEPIEGLDAMRRRRNSPDLRKLADGPGKLCQAMGIDRSFDGLPLWESGLVYLEEGDGRKVRIASSERIGISSGKELALRYFMEGNPCVSRL